MQSKVLARVSSALLALATAQAGAQQIPVQELPEETLVRLIPEAPAAPKCGDRAS